MSLADDLVLLLARATLAAVLVAAGAAKLVDTRGFATTLVGLGLPARRDRLVTATATAIPLLELGVGFMAVTRIWPIATSLVVLVLAASFTALTAWALTRRPRVECRCFGTLTDSQFSRRGLARSALLTVTAGLVLWYETVRAPALAASAGWTLMLLLGYGVFALAAAQGATTLSALKDAEEGRTA